VVLRLGRYSRTTGPGLRFKLPWPIDKVYKVPVAKVQSMEFGRRTLTAGRRTQYAPVTEEDRTVARMLTADLNLAHVPWVVQYQIKDARDYLFRIGGERGADAAENARDLIGDVAEAVIRRITGDRSVDSVITIGRDEIADLAQEEMQTMLDRFQAGIVVRDVKLKGVAPPDPVKDAFDAVDRAKQNKKKVVNEAKGERNRLIPAARGKRDRAVAEAEGYALRVQKEAEGKAKAFLAKLAEFDKAPEITRTRLYLEAMEEVLAQVDEKIVIDESVKGLLPLLHLDAGNAGTKRAAPSLPVRRGGVQ
jgi:membrane protease subunit HflK